MIRIREYNPKLTNVICVANTSFYAGFMEGVNKKINWPNMINETLHQSGGFVNICYQALDRHISTPLKDAVAIRYIDESWNGSPEGIQNISYFELYKETNRFAQGLKKLGAQKGDMLFTLSPRVPELYTVALGSLRAGVVFSPLFCAFGPDPILSRMKKGKGKILFTLASLYHKKVAPIRSELTDLKHVILIDDDGSLKDIPGAIDFDYLMMEDSTAVILEKTSPLDPALLHFTSGTTGEPKGALHVHQAVVYHEFSGKHSLGLKEGSLFWCTADPGWVTGTSYGIISPLCNGVTMLVDGAEFNPQRWYEVLSQFKVEVWYTAPTALRMLMRAGEELPKKFDFSSVKFAASVGEALNPEVIHWVKKNLKIELHDNWWQTETGGIMIANDLNLAVRAGSMGRPLPGIEIALIKKHVDGKIEFVLDAGEQGEIAIKRGWPSLFQTYLENPARYAKCFVEDWYLSGDIAKFDEDGDFWFVGRADDLIKSSGHLIGPFEVESILMEHPSVLEAGVIGIPDPLAGELVKGLVVLRPGITPSQDLKSNILAFARKKLGVAVSPREISFIDNLPKTKSGKVMRRLLKTRELGLPEGDLSTLENPI